MSVMSEGPDWEAIQLGHRDRHELCPGLHHQRGGAKLAVGRLDVGVCYVRMWSELMSFAARLRFSLPAWHATADSQESHAARPSPREG